METMPTGDAPVAVFDRLRRAAGRGGGWVVSICLAVGLLGTLVLSWALPRTADPLPGTPSVFLWAWERPEDLRFLDPSEAGVAFLAGTIVLASDEVIVEPRFQPLQTAPGASLIPVVRIETDNPELSPIQMEQTADAIERLTFSDHADAVQIDFDATTSERAFYRDLLLELDRRREPQLPLMITALASWYLGDPWIRDLPIADAIPMLFEMGPDEEAVRVRLGQGRDFSLPVCRQSLGIATYESLGERPAGRRTYVFHSKPWNRHKAREAIREAKSWQ